MATIGPGRMDIEYLEGDDLDDVMRITEKSNVPNSEDMVVYNENGEIITIEDIVKIWNIKI